MELRHARHVLAVVDHGGFGRAAEGLHIAQSVVSEQVARLERELGVALFDRSRRSPVLTAAGERFVPAARALVEAERAAVAAATGVRVRRVGIGAGRRMRELAAELPGDRGVPVETVRLGRAERLAGLRRGSLDVALAHGPVAEPDVTARDVGTSGLTVVLAAGDRLLDDVTGDDLLARLARRPLLLSDDDPASPVRQALARSGLGAVARGVPGAGDITDLLAAVSLEPGSWSVVFADRAEGLRPEAHGVAFLAAPALVVPVVAVTRRPTGRRSVSPPPS